MQPRRRIETTQSNSQLQPLPSFSCFNIASDGSRGLEKEEAMNTETSFINQATQVFVEMQNRLAASFVQSNPTLPVYVQPGTVLVTTNYQMLPIFGSRLLMV